MTEPKHRETYPDDFQRQSLNLVNRLLKLDSSGFYLVSANMHTRGVVLRNIEARANRDYEQKYRELDPLNPALFAACETRVACIDELLEENELLSSDYYKGFMKPLNHRHVADMFFRHNGDIIAVLTMLRSIDTGPFTDAELLLLRDLQPFLEYTLNSVYMPSRYRERATIQQRFKLTERELDVVELIITGASNKNIARELDMSLATVKTHLQHVFHKLEVPSRTALSAMILGELST